MRDETCFEIKARDIFLRPLTITSGEIFETLRQPMVLLFAGLLTLTLVVLDAAHLEEYMAWWQAALIWSIATTVQIGTYTALTLLWGGLGRRWPLPPVFLPANGLLAYLVSYLCTASLVQWTTGRGWDEIFGPEILLTGYGFAAIGEAIYFAFVLPQLRLRLQQEGPPARSIAVAGQRFELDTILTLRGQEHHVLVQTAERTHRLRGRLGDLISQTRESDGVLAHRSYWVASRAITRLERGDDGHDTIVTTAGERLRVARPRQGAVRAWLARHAPEVAAASERA